MNLVSSDQYLTEKTLDHAKNGSNKRPSLLLRSTDYTNKVL